MNFSFRQLRAFVAVAQWKNFTKASQNMHITQAGLSAMIKDLEVQMGCRLFDRTTRVVTLTDAGVLLHPVALRTVRELEDVHAQVKDEILQGHRVLRVGVTPLIASSLVPRLLKQYAKRKNSYQLDILEEPRERIQELVETGDLDAGFGIFFSDVSGLNRQAMFPTPLMAVLPGSGTNRVHALRTCTWSSLEGAALVCLAESNPIQLLVDKTLKDAGISIPDRIRVTHLQSAIAYVDQGFGISVMPAFARMACTRYQVECSLLERPAVPLDYYCITRAGTDNADRSAGLIEEFVFLSREW
jgi:DNA-binding transcriptional LysR family regulator